MKNIKNYVQSVVRNILLTTLRFFWVFTIVVTSATAAGPLNSVPTIDVGANQVNKYLPFLVGKRVGLVVNQTSVVTDVELSAPKHLVDVLVNKKVNVTHIFSPEHGIRGDHADGEIVKSQLDKKTGLPIISIYGKNKRPPASIMAELDVIVFDIQDVGARFYTYISTMFYVLQAAQQWQLPVVILDRPNPHINNIDGPLLEYKFRSFVGMLPIPMLHGMTVGELAKMSIGEGWINLIEPLPSLTRQDFKTQFSLTVIPIKNYHRDTPYVLPISPSPNLPNQSAINLYPSLCLFEATPISIGRGTDFPFQVVGHDQYSIGDFQFVPQSIPGVSKYPKLENKNVTGTDLRIMPLGALQNGDEYLPSFSLKYVFDWYLLFKKNEAEFFSRATFFDKLAGTDKLRKAMISGATLEEIEQGWQADIERFKVQRQPYLLYK